MVSNDLWPNPSKRGPGPPLSREVVNRTPDTREEAAAKLPALHVMMVMRWVYVSPTRALAMRGSERGVLLLPVLREWLERHRFSCKDQDYPLSPAAIYAVIHETSATGLSEGLLAAN